MSYCPTSAPFKLVFKPVQQQIWKYKFVFIFFGRLCAVSAWIFVPLCAEYEAVKVFVCFLVRIDHILFHCCHKGDRYIDDQAMIYCTFRLFVGDFKAPMDLRLLPDCSFSSSLGTIVLVSPKSMWTSGQQVREDIGPKTRAINNSLMSHSRSCKYSLSRLFNSIKASWGFGQNLH
jgi:hypothetical protein